MLSCHAAGSWRAEVARGVDDVHLGAREVVHRPGDLSGRAGARISWLITTLPLRRLDPPDQRVPAALGVAGLAAPVLAEQVERGPEVEQPGAISGDRVGIVTSWLGQRRRR